MLADVWQLWRRDRERSRRVIRLAVANWLAYYDMPSKRRPAPDPQVSSGFAFYAFGPDAPATARTLAPEALDRWLNTTYDAFEILRSWDLAEAPENGSGQITGHSWSCWRPSFTAAIISPNRLLKRRWSAPISRACRIDGTDCARTRERLRLGRRLIFGWRSTNGSTPVREPVDAMGKNHRQAEVGRTDDWDGGDIIHGRPQGDRPLCCGALAGFGVALLVFVARCSTRSGR